MKRFLLKLNKISGTIALVLVLAIFVMAAGQASNFARIVLGEANYGADPNSTADITFQNDEYISNATDGSLDWGEANIAATGTIDLTITNTTAGGETGIYSYPTHTTNALTGELIAVRGSARVSTIDSPSGQVIGGKFQAGNMTVGTDLSVVRGVYTEVVNKIPSGATTWSYARGVEINMDLDQGSSGNVNTITNTDGLYILFNLPTDGTYASVGTGYGARIVNEAVGGTGQQLDAAIYIDDVSMSGGIKGWNYGIDMSGIGNENFGTSDILMSSGAKIFTGNAANGDAVYAEVGAKDATGSIYLTTAGALYIQVANAGAAADWYKVTMSDAD